MAGSHLIFKGTNVLSIYTGNDSRFQLSAYKKIGGQLERPNIKEINHMFGNGFEMRTLGRGQTSSEAKKWTFEIMPFFSSADNASIYMLNIEKLAREYPVVGALTFASPCGEGAVQSYQYTMITDISDSIQDIRYCLPVDSGFNYNYNCFLKFTMTFCKLKDSVDNGYTE